MRIVFDGRSIHGTMGGIGRVALELCRALVDCKSRHTITLLLGRSASEQAVVEGVQVVQVDAAMIDEGFEQLRLPVVLERLGSDLYFNPCFSVPAIKTTRFQISMIHDVVFEEKPEWVEDGLRTYLSKWSRFAASEADHIITGSDDALRRINANYGVDARRISRIYHGVPDEAHETVSDTVVQATRRKYGLTEEYVLYLGSIEPKKGVPELVDAFTRLRNSGLSGCLVLAGGKGGLELDLPRERFIRYVGYIPESDKKPLLQGASLFVYPSKYEGFGLPPLEAMALGIPCVVSSETSLPEISGDVAIVVDVKQPDLFVNALERGLGDAVFRKRAAKGGPKRARRFSWRQAASEFLEVCEALESS